MLWKRFSRPKLKNRKPSTDRERKFSDNKRLRSDPVNRTLQTTPKRKAFDTATNQGRVKKKRKMRDGNGVDERTNTVDRISELPDPIILHILSFLRCPKDVTRTSVLSKKWRSTYASFLSFDFDQKRFKALGGGEVQQAEFKRFVESSLSTRIAPLVWIQKFRLHITSFGPKMARHIDRWLCAATTKNVKELEISVERKRRLRYSVPQIVLAAYPLTSLKLYGCKLDKYKDMKLPNLQQLSMKKMHINHNIIQSFVRGCPMIEDFRLIHSDGLEALNLSTLVMLNRVEVHQCNGLESVEIEAPNLETLWCYGKKAQLCNVKLNCCENLRSLTLKDTSMTDELFQDQINKFPVLEKLVLMECDTLERLTILSYNLKILVVVRCKKLHEAIVDAPNLHTFEYTGDKTFSFSLTAPKLQEAKLNFESSRKAVSKGRIEGHIPLWMVNLQEFLGSLNQSKNLNLVVRHKKDMLISEDLEGIELPLEHDLKLEISNPSTKLEDLLDSLLRISHPETLSVVSPSDSEFLKLLHDKMMNREENPACCRYYSRKCWLHYLKDVKTGDSLTSALRRRDSSSTLYKTTAFKLEWTAR